METVFEIVPAGMKPFYFLLPIFVLLLGVLCLLGMTGYGSQRERFVLSDAGLDFRGDIWGRRLPWETLHLSQARVVNLSQEPNFRPRSRRAGTALPGYQSGWFRLVNGQRALVYVTSWHRVLYVPTSAGYALLLSPRDPDGMLRELQRRAQGR